YGIVFVVLGLWGAQLLSHIGALRGDVLLQLRGVRLGLDLILVLISVIGGRVIPLFTRNTTGFEIHRAPLLDKLAIASVVACAVADLWGAYGWPLALVFGVAAVLTLVRARGWGTRQALREPMLWVLHVGYLFLPLGLGLRALAALF